jgi:hypothetical protein
LVLAAAAALAHTFFGMCISSFGAYLERVEAAFTDM